MDDFITANKENMRIVFLGNHTVGTTVLEEIVQYADVVGVVAHPQDEEDGVVYKSVYNLAIAKKIPSLRGRGKDASVLHFVKDLQPNLLWITDYRYLLPLELIDLAPLGAVNLHPSLLPQYRGRAPINWAILHNEQRFGLTAHFVDSGMDTGDIISQRCYDLRLDQDVGDALELLYPLYREITGEVLKYFLSGNVPRTPQDHDKATSYPRRVPKDGAIDWRWSARRILNLIRAVARPYPGAFASLDGKIIKIWKASLDAELPTIKAAPGTVLHYDQQSLYVHCGDIPLLLSEVDYSAVPNGMILPGTVLDIPTLFTDD